MLAHPYPHWEEERSSEPLYTIRRPLLFVAMDSYSSIPTQQDRVVSRAEATSDRGIAVDQPTPI
jgi:hypothetical protein